MDLLNNNQIIKIIAIKNEIDFWIQSGKLIFTKDENNEITVQLQKGTVLESFTYTEMISQLLEKNEFVGTEFVDLSPEEEASINKMLEKINVVFEEEEKEEDGIEEEAEAAE